MDLNGYTFLWLCDVHLAYGAAMCNAFAAQTVSRTISKPMFTFTPLFTSTAQHLRYNYTNLGENLTVHVSSTRPLSH